MGYDGAEHGLYTMHAPRIAADTILRAYRPASFPWPSGATIPSCSGCRRKRAASFRWTSFTFPSPRPHGPQRSLHRQSRHCLRGCDARLRRAAPDSEESWINDEILSLYTHFIAGSCPFRRMLARRLLVGGLYGVQLGGAFFGESMFTRDRDASKVALVHLVARLRAGGFALLDAQFLTSHLAQFGAIEIPREDYLGCWKDALERGAVLLAGAFRQFGHRFLGRHPATTVLTGAVDATERRHLARLVCCAADHPDVIERMLQPVERRARRQHPAGKHRARRLHRDDDLRSG